LGKVLSHAEAREFYDWMGVKQDGQAFYEDRATGNLVAHGSFGTAQAVVEFGCGTGRFAKGLLEQRMPPTSSYVGVDISPEMIELAHENVDRFGTRTSVRLSDGDPHIDLADGCCDRFVSNYVFDLLSEEDCAAVVREAARLLAPEGLLCLVSLSTGFTRISRLVERMWTRVHSFRPWLVGGCRPIELLGLLSEADWEIRHHRRLAPFGIPSEVVIVARR